MSARQYHLEGSSIQEHLAAIVESCDDAIISKDLGGIIRSWNFGAERIFGYKAEEAIGQHISMLAPPDRFAEIPQILQRISRGEQIDHYETRRRTKDGRILAISLTISPIRNADGKIIGASKVARDVTMENSYREAREHLASIVESSDDAVISKDLQGYIRSWNRGAERIFGYTADETIGKHVSMLAIPERVDEIPNILRRIASGERIEHYQTRRKTKDGRVLFVSLTVSPIRDASGTIVGASKIARDVTDLMQAQEALRYANERLLQSNSDLEQFAYSASHDLQEPLRMIAIYGQLLEKRLGERLGVDGKEYVEQIVRNTGRMDKLLSDLRLFVQASAAGTELSEDADSEGAVRRVIEVLEPMVGTTGAVITFESLPKVHIASFQLEQLFQNLLSNAIRYRASDAPRIHIRGESRDGIVQFSVRDNGIGIDPRYKSQIFGMFKRLHTTADYPGNGMGLAICQRIVERAGGQIWVDSEPGAGSTFYFEVPAARGK